MKTDLTQRRRGAKKNFAPLRETLSSMDHFRFASFDPISERS
jgi:hypothetical protein